MNKPSLGRIVIYRSRTGAYSCPAMITATPESLNQAGVDAGFVPALTSPDNVHLTVFTPGRPGKRGDAKDFIGNRADAPISENVSGCYQEWDVPPSSVAAIKPDDEAQPAGTWAWPPRA